MARFAAAADDVAAAANTTAQSTRKRARCALRRFKGRRGRVRECGEGGQRRRAGCRKGQGTGPARWKVLEAENETAVENLAGEFHAETPAIFAFFTGWWWLAMRGVDQVVCSGLPHADGFSIRRVARCGWVGFAGVSRVKRSMAKVRGLHGNRMGWGNS
ncbi:uncharacterized protein K441DRAFT_650763 [Cenococcum geophilum 1.58]|uniref:uncharacterized protein n=1 Tax=Cenococcum geophilum 1.58 TaxID=794803 RepID=UPI00358F0F21|nr:hypothetical protein K441DRAFT_650763 [Cenococcum geophilum 1.58]